MATMKRSPSALTMELLEKDGWIVWTVERIIPRVNKKVDLWNCFDQVAIRNGELICLQPTSWSNVSARVKKIGESEYIGEVRKLNFGLYVYGWKWCPRTKQWLHKIVDVS